MLRDLIATIETLKERIKEHRSYLGQVAPEARTRVSLIDPMLQALEWDVGDPSLVEIEPMVGKGRVDYSLRRRGGEPVLLLEAKKLSDTSAPYDQIASYVVGENLRRSVKIPYCAITNGSRWQVFDVFTQQCVLDASVELDEPRRCALKLLGLWQPTLRDLAVLEPVGTWHGESVGTIAERGSQSRLRDSAHSAAGPSRPLSAGASVDWTPLDSDTLNPSKYVRPTEIRFPDGSNSKMESWASMLVATAKWLFDAGLLTRKQMPLTVAGSRYCVSLDGHRPDGTKFGRPLPVGQTGIQIEGDFTAKQIVRFAVDLLKQFGKAPSQVGLRLQRTPTEGDG